MIKDSNGNVWTSEKAYERHINSKETRRKSGNERRKLSKDDVNYILKNYENSCHRNGGYAMARKFKVCANIISDVLKGTYKPRE